MLRSERLADDLVWRLGLRWSSGREIVMTYAAEAMVPQTHEFGYRHESNRQVRDDLRPHGVLIKVDELARANPSRAVDTLSAVTILAGTARPGDPR